MNLLIVESPAKAKTINKYLGDQFEVIATVGHFRDLAKKNGVVISEDQKDVILNWETTSAGEKLLDNIRKKAINYETIYLATDPDREGEAITWHLVNSLEKDVDSKKWLVKCDQDSEVIGVRSCVLKIENEAVGVPTDELQSVVS